MKRLRVRHRARQNKASALTRLVWNDSKCMSGSRDGRVRQPRCADGALGCRSPVATPLYTRQVACLLNGATSVAGRRRASFMRLPPRRPVPAGSGRRPPVKRRAPTRTLSNASPRWSTHLAPARPPAKLCCEPQRLSAEPAETTGPSTQPRARFLHAESLPSLTVWRSR